MKYAATWWITEPEGEERFSGTLCTTQTHALTIQLERTTLRWAMADLTSGSMFKAAGQLKQMELHARKQIAKKVGHVYQLATIPKKMRQDG